MLLEVKNLHAGAEGKEILKGVSLRVRAGEIHAIMGPNGSGKSTLANVIMGNPAFAVTSGSMLLNGKDFTTMPPHKRAQKGVFLSFQYPSELPGVSTVNFLRTALQSVRGKKITPAAFLKLLREKAKLLKIDDAFLKRHVNEGFSGGEKKRMEILQMAVLEPKLAVLDETDSGLDIDSLKIVAEGINRLLNPQMGVLLITHYRRILGYVKPDRVHVMKDGRIVLSGGSELVDKLEKEGYDWVSA